MPARPELPNPPNYPEPRTREQALTLAYYIILVAPDDEKAQAARILAEEFAAGLDESTVEICKAAALERWEADVAELRGALLRDHRA